MGISPIVAAAADGLGVPGVAAPRRCYGSGVKRVWDYPRPPAVKPCARRVRVEWDGEVLADSIRALIVLETTHPPTIYIPPADVRLGLLIATNVRRGVRAKRVTSMCSLPGTGRTQSPEATRLRTGGMRRCAITSRSIPVAWMSHGLTTSACKRSRATSTGDGSPAIWLAP